jgi:cobalt-zinc-cadmium efflux system outer membrane protein
VAGELEWQGYNQTSVGASVQWSLPVAQSAQGDRAVARAQAAAADVERDLAGRAAAREAATAWAALGHALDELSTLDERVLPTQARTLALTEALFQAGAVDLFRVLLARQERVAAQLRRLEALRAAWQARIELDRATAEP